MDKSTFNGTEKIIFDSELIHALSTMANAVGFLYKDINEEFFKQINLKNEELRIKNEEILKLNKENLHLEEKIKSLKTDLEHNKNLITSLGDEKFILIKKCDKLWFFLRFSWTLFIVLCFLGLKFIKLI